MSVAGYLAIREHRQAAANSVQPGTLWYLRVHVYAVWIYMPSPYHAYTTLAVGEMTSGPLRTYRAQCGVTGHEVLGQGPKGRELSNLAWADP